MFHQRSHLTPSKFKDTSTIFITYVTEINLRIMGDSFRGYEVKEKTYVFTYPVLYLCLKNDRFEKNIYYVVIYKIHFLQQIAKILIKHKSSHCTKKFKPLSKLKFKNQ